MHTLKASVHLSDPLQEAAQAGGRGESLLLRAYTALVEGVNVVEALPPSHPSRMQSHASLLVMLQYVAKVPLVCARVCTCAE